MCHARVLLRGCSLLALFFPLVAPFPVCPSGPYWRIVRGTLESAGPTFVKLGQWASTRPDIFPPECVRSLSGLHAGVTQHGMAHTRRLIEQAFGCRMEDIFERFETIAIGSGCIAQVHRATLRGTEEPVAVKVIHPNVESTINVRQGPQVEVKVGG